jgi:starvation-inducible DNA-binding protein
LKILLANEYVLQVKTQNFHWNVTGISFGSLHSLFDSQYSQLAGFVDLIAERIRALQFFVPGSLVEFKRLATLQEDEGTKLLDKEMIKKLLDGHEFVIAGIRSDIDFSKSVNDAGTENFLADILVKHEKIAWILRAHLES